MPSAALLSTVTTTTSTTFGGSFGVLAVLAILAGVFVFGYGLLVLPTSVLGGVWIGAIGLSLALSGLFATEWAGDRFDLSAPTRRRLSLAFVGLAAVLLVAFVVINFAAFESGDATGGR